MNIYLICGDSLGLSQDCTSSRKKREAGQGIFCEHFQFSTLEYEESRYHETNGIENDPDELMIFC
jgi:hypothetical protein